MLKRREAADWLKGKGFPTTPKNLATLAYRGKGPKYVKYNGMCLYSEKDLAAWIADVTTEVLPRE